MLARGWRNTKLSLSSILLYLSGMYVVVVVVFTLIVVCSSDISLSSRPRFGLATTYIILGIVEARSKNVKNTHRTHTRVRTYIRGHRQTRAGTEVGISYLKVAVNTIVPRSPFFCFCTSKPRLLHTSEKTRSNISVNGMALFVLFTTCVKGKKSADTHGERGGLPTRRDSGPTRYGCAPH